MRKPPSSRMTSWPGRFLYCSNICLSPLVQVLEQRARSRTDLLDHDVDLADERRANRIDASKPALVVHEYRHEVGAPAIGLGDVGRGPDPEDLGGARLMQRCAI